MDRGELHEAVARAIAESVGGASFTPGDDDYVLVLDVLVALGDA